ncbi:MAG TPA: 8-amino-7-oxononanoate synthase, partial [Micromonosporaceae bacterium]|nr:8-amino-7-oxononanoate synthase [Micromonosporaceae bacterium]
MSVPYNDWLATLTRKAALREKAGLRRSAAPRVAAVDLAGNDYLGLSSHPRVLAAASQALADFGLGATGSRLVRGTTQLHEELELALAAWIGTERALVYSSGYLANLGVIRALAGLSPKTLLISDAHCHASMIDGCRLAGAETVVFEHGSADHAASLLQPGRPNVILTESVFSVDGDLAPLKELHDVARSHGALLLVDDAHGLGVTDAVSFLAGEPDVIITATLSKALGGAGGVVAGPAPLIAHLIDTSRTFIFDTALPPAVAAGVLAALEIARDAGDLRLELHRRARLLTALPGSSFPAGGYVADLGNGNVAEATETLRDSDTHPPGRGYGAVSLTENDVRTPFSMSGFETHISSGGAAAREG